MAPHLADMVRVRQTEMPQTETRTSCLVRIRARRGLPPLRRQGTDPAATPIGCAEMELRARGRGARLPTWRPRPARRSEAEAEARKRQRTPQISRRGAAFDIARKAFSGTPFRQNSHSA